MFKRILTGCSFLLLLILSSVVADTTAAYAQTPDPTPSAVTSQEKVSPEELKRFSTAMKRLLVIADETETEMRQAVKNDGFSEIRFNEIYIAKTKPNSQPKNPITPEEQQKYDQLVGKLTQIQNDANSRMDKAVQSQGLQFDRFKQIFEIVDKNPQLKQEVQQMLQN
jgi:hypothetical protein